MEKNYPPSPPSKYGKSGNTTAPTHGRPLIAAYLRTNKVVIIKDGASILDDESEEELHGGIGQASGSFDKKDGQVVRILREVAEGRPFFLSAVRPAFFKGKKLLVAHLVGSLVFFSDNMLYIIIILFLFQIQIEKLLWVCPFVVPVYYALNIICIISHDLSLSKPIRKSA